MKQNKKNDIFMKAQYRCYNKKGIARAWNDIKMSEEKCVYSAYDFNACSLELSSEAVTEANYVKLSFRANVGMALAIL